MKSMKKSKLLLVSPLPPPYGGIARWTEQLTAYLNEKKIINYRHLDIAVRWRSVHSGVWLRLLGGNIQLFYNYLKFIYFLFLVAMNVWWMHYYMSPEALDFGFLFYFPYLSSQDILCLR